MLFRSVLGAEAVLPAEIRCSSHGVNAYTEAGSNTALEDDIDAPDEARDIALARSVGYQRSLRNYHSRRVRDRSFVVGDLVLGLKQKKSHKLSPP